MAEKQDVQIEYSQLQQFVAAALEQPEIPIIGAARAPLGVIIHRLFMTSQKVFCFTLMSFCIIANHTIFSLNIIFVVWSLFSKTLYTRFILKL